MLIFRLLEPTLLAVINGIIVLLMLWGMRRLLRANKALIDTNKTFSDQVMVALAAAREIADNSKKLVENVSTTELVIQIVQSETGEILMEKRIPPTSFRPTAPTESN